MPGDEAIIWPSFTNVGPSTMNASTSARLSALSSETAAPAAQDVAHDDRGTR